MDDMKTAPASWDHPKNIRIGQGRVLWGTACTDISGRSHPEAWVLPGGARTANEATARAAAIVLDAMSGSPA